MTMGYWIFDSGMSDGRLNVKKRQFGGKEITFPFMGPGAANGSRGDDLDKPLS